MKQWKTFAYEFLCWREIHAFQFSSLFLHPLIRSNPFTWVTRGELWRVSEKHFHSHFSCRRSLQVNWGSFVRASCVKWKCEENFYYYFQWKIFPYFYVTKSRRSNFSHWQNENSTVKKKFSSGNYSNANQNILKKNSLKKTKESWENRKEQWKKRKSRCNKKVKNTSGENKQDKKMKLWKSKKSATSSCVSAVSGKLNLSGNKNGYKDDDQSETNSSAQATPTASQSTIHLANGLHQGDMMMSDTSTFHRRVPIKKIKF